MFLALLVIEFPLLAELGCSFLKEGEYFVSVKVAMEVTEELIFPIQHLGELLAVEEVKFLLLEEEDFSAELGVIFPVYAVSELPLLAESVVSLLKVEELLLSVNVEL